MWKTMARVKEPLQSWVQSEHIWHSEPEAIGYSDGKWLIAFNIFSMAPMQGCYEIHLKKSFKSFSFPFDRTPVLLFATLPDIQWTAFPAVYSLQY